MKAESTADIDSLLAHAGWLRRFALALVRDADEAEDLAQDTMDADNNLKKQLSRQQFEGMCGLYTKPLKKGYTLEYFGQLKQRGMAVYVWKVSVPGEQEDVLIKLAMKDGKVGGVRVF